MPDLACRYRDDKSKDKKLTPWRQFFIGSLKS